MSGSTHHNGWIIVAASLLFLVQGTHGGMLVEYSYCRNCGVSKFLNVTIVLNWPISPRIIMTSKNTMSSPND
jgi:hypothetical protein